jgi:hypothetical protein
MTPLDAAQKWLQRGFLVVPVPHRQKKPVEQAWQSLRLSSDDLRNHFNSQPKNIGILLGDEAGTADIDCDCPEAIAAASELAPETGMVFGRKSKPASHYIFRATGGLLSSRFVDPTDKRTIAELRCRKKDGSIGLQTIVPPSTHESGELIRFEDGRNREPRVVSAELLQSAAQKIAAAALLAKHWPKEGSRHDAFLALAGILARASWSLEDAIQFNAAIYRSLWGRVADPAASRAEVQSTFERHRNGTETTGFQRLTEIVDVRVVNSALGWIGIGRAPGSSVRIVEWPEITPLTAGNPTALSSDLFPGFLGDMARAVSRATESPIELAGLLGLGVVSASIAGRVLVTPEPGYEEPTNLYIAVAMESGNRKTAVLKSMTQPFTDWEKEQMERKMPERTQILSRRKTLEAQIDALRKKAARGTPDASFVDQIASLDASLPEVPAIPRLWVQDVTPEQLGVLMHENDQRIALLSDEGGVFDLLAGRYSNRVPNLDLFLQAHSGGAVRVDRGSRSPVFLTSPALTLAICPQPHVLQRLSDQPEFRSRGLLARIIFALPASPLGNRSLIPASVPLCVGRAYHTEIRRLLELELRGDDSENRQFKLRFTGPAYLLWKEFQRRIEVEMREGQRLQHVRDWASKLPGTAARIAGVFHCVSNHPAQNLKIDAETATMAINLSSALIDHALAAFDLMKRDQVVEDARRILRWLQKDARFEITVRECFCAFQGHFKTVAPLTPAIRLLIEHGYLRNGPQAPSVGRPSERYLVNPAFYGQGGDL